MTDTYGVAIYGTDVYGSTPAPTPPSNTVAPAVSGQAQVSSAVSCTSGTWTDSGHISYGYQWQDSSDGSTNWGNITGATSSSYTIPSSEGFRYLRCVVTDTDANGSTAANSNVVGPVSWPLPVNTVAPVVSGTAQVASIVSSTSGTWTDDGSPVFSYQWQNSADNVTWGNLSQGALYMIENARQGDYLRCVVTNTDSGGAASATSNVIGPVVAIPNVGIPLNPVVVNSLTLAPDLNYP